MKKIVQLLNKIDTENPKDVITSIQIFSDESGRIIQTEKAVADFVSLKEAGKLLKQMSIDFKKNKI